MSEILNVSLDGTYTELPWLNFSKVTRTSLKSAAVSFRSTFAAIICNNFSVSSLNLARSSLLISSSPSVSISLNPFNTSNCLKNASFSGESSLLAFFNKSLILFSDKAIIFCIVALLSSGVVTGP